MKLRKPLSSISLGVIAMAAIAMPYLATLSAQAVALSDDGTQAYLDFQFNLDRPELNKELGIVNLFSAKGAQVLNFRLQTVDSTKYSDSEAVITGTGIVRNFRGMSFKSNFTLHITDSEEAELGSSDLFAMELHKYPGGPLLFNGKAFKGDIDLAINQK